MDLGDWLLANGIVPYDDLKIALGDALAAQRKADDTAMRDVVRKHIAGDFPLDIVSDAILNARIEVER